MRNDRVWLCVWALAMVLSVGCGDGHSPSSAGDTFDSDEVSPPIPDSNDDLVHDEVTVADAADTSVNPGDVMEELSEPVLLTPKSLVIVLDGVRPDALASADTPYLDQLIFGQWQPGYQGAYAPYAQNLYDAITLSGPNHATLMTGANSQQHGVTSNFDVLLGKFDAYPHYLTLLNEWDAESKTVCMFTWSSDAYIKSYADYIKDSEDASNVSRAVQILSADFEDEKGDGKSSWALGDDVDAIFLFLDDPDHVGHGHGFEMGVPEYRAALQKADEQLGEILNALSERATFAQESWQIVLTSDHGGYHTGHGGAGAAEHTIPLLIASRDVVQGELGPNTRNVDVVPTVLSHMKVPIPDYMTGSVRGNAVLSDSEGSLLDQLILYLPFDADFKDASGDALDVQPGPNSVIDPAVIAGDGKQGGYLQLNGDAGASYLSLGNPPELDMGNDDAFSVSLWIRSHGIYDGDPVILGNKDWVSGQNPGWVLLANEGADNSFGSNYASVSFDRIDLEDIDYSDSNWWFLTAVFQPDGLAILYAGDSQGNLRWIALKADGVGSLVSDYPLNIGQDGTGDYSYNLNSDLDELAIWRRALSTSEVKELYNNGAGMTLISQ